MEITLTHHDAVMRLANIREEIERIAAKQNKTREDDEKVPQLVDEYRKLDRYRLDLEHDMALQEIRDSAARGNTEPAVVPDPERDSEPEPRFVTATRRTSTNRAHRDPWNLTEVRTFGRDPSAVQGELRERALDAIERMPYAPDNVREAATKFVAERDDSQSRIARLCLATSSPSYMRAFTKLIRSQGQVGMLAVDEQQSIDRAMSLTDSAGGYLVPFQLDPTVILTAAGSRNRIRQIARVVTATGDIWNGVSSAGVTGSWDAEAAEVSDDAPTFAQPSIPVYKQSIFVPISIEALQDEANVAAEIARMIAFEKDRMESVAFVSGTGSGQPTGIVTALDGGGSVVNSAATDTFAVGDVYALDSALPSRFADGATWVAHRAIYNLIRQFDTAGGASLWTTLGNGLPPVLLGRPAETAEAMDSTVTALAENNILIFGDFTNYVIADRVGTTVEFISHLFATGNNRPSGQRGWYAYARVGADSVNDGAFRMLNVT